MKLWCHLPTGIKRRNVLRFAVLSSMVVALITTLIFARAAQAAPNTTRTINFQGRLLSSAGAVVADGHYNIQFKIYEGGNGTSANNGGVGHVWTESYVNNNSNGGVVVKNGFFSVSLGSKNPFNNSVNWDNDKLWLSMNVAGNAAACSTFGAGPCDDDGEMLPMKQMTATPYAINAGAIGGKTADNFVQLAQGVQNDTANNSTSIHINKTGTDGEFMKFQSAGIDALTINRDGNILFGTGGALPFHGIGVETATNGQNGEALAFVSGNGGAGNTSGGNLLLQGGDSGDGNGNGGDVIIAGGIAAGTGNDGSLFLGTAHTRDVAIGGASTQNITIGGGENATQNIIIGTDGTATSGTTTIQSKDDTVIATNGTQRARFSGTGNTLYVGNANASGNATTANNFTIQGTSSTGANTQGGSVSVIAGSATNGNANGGNLTLGGGAGVGTGAEGLVVFNSPTAFQSASLQTCGTNCAVNQANVDGNGVVTLSASAPGVTFTLAAPTNTTAGRIVYITAGNGSNDFTLSVNGGGAGNLTSMRQNTTATMVWSGTAWTVAGASNSTTLQSAYDNTLQSAGGAELIVSSGSNANGLTIRDSSTNPVNGTLLEVQNASASTLFSVNSNVPEYATNGGAETAGSTGSEFPSNTWTSHGSSTVSRHTPADTYVATGQASAQAVTTGANSGMSNRLSTTLTPNMTYNVSFGVRLNNGSLTDMQVAYTPDGSGTLTNCKNNATAAISSWTKISCSFKTPTSGLNSSNAIIIRQVASANRTFYVDNLSVTIAGNQNYATDGNVNSALGTNWTSAGVGSVTMTRNILDGQESSDSAQAQVTGAAANVGLRNKLSIAPLTDTLYRITAYAKLDSGSMTDFKIRYSRDGSTTAGGNYVDCVDYNTRTISATDWTEVTCYIKTDSTAASNPHVYFVKEASGTPTFRIDSFEMTLATNTAANVQIGGGANGGQTTLFTLDQGASAPIADNNEALLGSMYYDTTLGKIQCFEADGWGACGSSPDIIVTMSPEFTNAVMHGDGVGTLTSDFCSNTTSLSVNTSICSTGQTNNFYKWTSPQATDQKYSIFVTYQLPSTFKSFSSGDTSISGRTDNGSSGGAASVYYTVMRKTSTDLITCGTSPNSPVEVSTGTKTAWQTGKAIGTADPSTCGFQPGESIVFKIDVSASKNATAYVSNLGFSFSNR